MNMLTPNYTSDNFAAAYQLNWSLSLFWKQEPIPAEQWLEPLKLATEADKVRILEHRQLATNASQFLLSTQTHISPSASIRSVKARLQCLIRDSRPKAFRRNYSIHSVGSANSKSLNKYVATQFDHHRMADERVQRVLADYQINDPSIDLSRVRQSSYGQYIYNLQLVLVYNDRGVDVRKEWLKTTCEMTLGISQRKGHLLRNMGIAADHLHLLLGCGVTQSPRDVALSYMNNLAYAHGMARVFQFGFYVGTFGRYDLNAIRRVLS